MNNLTIGRSGMTVGRKTFASVMSLFVVFAVLFIVFQQSREKEFKIESLNQRLQEYNAHMMESFTYQGRRMDEASLDSFIARHPLPQLRVTVIDRRGQVLFDNERKDYRHIRNHLDRKEVKDALMYGKGYDINRVSSTLHGDFFYSATYFPVQRVVVRTALPYNNDLVNSLRADQHYIWFAVVTLLLLAVVLYRFFRRLDSNINKLRIFARRADHNESLDVEDLVVFPDDELGEISESIIKIYKRLQRTKEEQNILKRQLTQNVAHELKTPVASIQGYLETIIENPTIGDDMRSQFLERCYAQSRRLGSLLADISTLNRLDDGSSMVEFDAVDLVQIVQQVKKDTALQLHEKNMKFVDNLPVSIPLSGAPGMLYGIFRNLTDNAIAYAGEGTTITLNASEEPDCWHFVFSDNGVGVEPRHLGRLFERFYRVDKGRSRKLGGTGLGLAIVKNSVILHGGTIQASCPLAGGLRFDFTLGKAKK